MELLHKELTDKIIQSFYFVYNDLGHGFLERVYERALFLELQEQGLEVRSQQPIKVYYKSQLVGDYVADLLVDNTVIVEIKAAKQLVGEHKRQLINYLKATPIEVGLLLNFGPAPELVRRAFANTRK